MTGRKEPAQLQARHTPRNTSYFTSPRSQLASTPGATFSGCLLPINCKLKSSIVQGRCWSFAPLPQRIGNHHGQDTSKAWSGCLESETGKNCTPSPGSSLTSVCSLPSLLSARTLSGPGCGAHLSLDSCRRVAFFKSSTVACMEDSG